MLNFLGDDIMVKVKDISEIFLDDKDEYLEKEIYVIINGKLIETEWVNHIGGKIALSLKGDD